MPVSRLITKETLTACQQGEALYRETLQALIVLEVKIGGVDQEIVNGLVIESITKHDIEVLYLGEVSKLCGWFSAALSTAFDRDYVGLLVVLLL